MVGDGWVLYLQLGARTRNMVSRVVNDISNLDVVHVSVPLLKRCNTGSHNTGDYISKSGNKPSLREHDKRHNIRYCNFRASSAAAELQTGGTKYNG
jgi:hypothetical protein